jgi:hypothetical protein
MSLGAPFVPAPEQLSCCCGTTFLLTRLSAVVQVECLVSNLVTRKLVKGYISIEYKILVVAKGAVAKAFPPITAGSLQR